MFSYGQCLLGADCNPPNGELLPRYKWHFWNLQLHPCAFGYTVAHIEDGDKVKYIGKLNPVTK